MQPDEHAAPCGSRCRIVDPRKLWRTGSLRGAEGDAHFAESRAHRIDRGTHFGLAEPANAADAEAVGDGELAGVSS